MTERALDVSRKAAGVLEERGFEQARLESELLLAGILGLKRLDLYLQHDRPLTENELEQYRSAVRRRLRREPVQYILGTAAFRGLDLQVDARVLIPRPETEVLAGAVLDWSRRQGRWGGVLDIGTGSGAIALSLVTEGEYERVVASDVSVDALDVARLNAARLGVADRIEFREGSLFDVVGEGERYDVIVSNPPYVAESDRGGLAAEVVTHEPGTALFAGADGLAVIGGLIAGAADRLRPGGLLALEMGAMQGPAVLDLLAKSGRYVDSRVERDLAGRDRIALAQTVGRGTHSA
ncbi:MAG TPA: peptide chain release factor N(5)-glutamine methyltransferase [Longimicrobiales bacterium]|nr:peptide chain release factor N(5)-glutamine methyltransferase [Longimicrobiales bacterium]